MLRKNILVSNDETNIKTFESFFQLKNREQKKIAFLMMNNESKSLLWKTKLKNDIIIGEYNHEQIKLIDELLGFLNPDFFDFKNNSINSSDVQIWKYKVSIAFDENQIVQLFNSLDVDNKNKNKTKASKLENDINDYMPDCSCNYDNDFCNKEGNDPTQWYQCKATICQRSSAGCGWIWIQECNGECRRFY